MRYKKIIIIDILTLIDLKRVQVVFFLFTVKWRMLNSEKC